MTYRDVLARSERRRPDGRPVWPITDADWPSIYTPRAIETRRAETLCGSVADESAVRQDAAQTLETPHGQ